MQPRMRFPYKLLFGLLFLICQTSFAGESWGGSGTADDPVWYEFKNNVGNGFWHTRGQTELSNGNVSISRWIDKSGSFVANKRTNSIGAGTYRLTTFTPSPNGGGVSK